MHEPRGAWNRRAAAWAARGSFGAIAVWLVAQMTAARAGASTLAAALDVPFVLLCHRDPERVISVAATPMPLCSRCAGLWLGLGVSAAIAWPVLPLRILRVVVPVAAALLLVELVTQDMGLHPVFHPTRLLSGLLLGVPFGGAIGGLIVREIGGGVPRARDTSAPLGG